MRVGTPAGKAPLVGCAAGRGVGRGARRGAEVRSSERRWLRRVSGRGARRARTLPLTALAEMAGFPPAGLIPSARSASRITLSSATASAPELRSMSRPNTTSSTSERICFLAAAAVRLPRGGCVSLGVPLPRANQLA